ncbi:MAG TPA: flagellar biosynthesis protein FlhB, partial [Caulobacterales bacterium]|nr:flagellar biosynthesis protein FlhB [Caulobacterales bacterium]
MAADDDDRTEEPTARKLEKAREQGDIIYSTEVSAALSLVALTLLLSYLAGPIASEISRSFIAFIAAPDQFSADPSSLRRIGMAVSIKVLMIFGMVAISLALAGLAARYLQDKPTFTPSRIAPKFDKLDPVKGFSRVFGKAAFAAFLKSLVKFVVVGVALASALWPQNAELQRISLLDPAAILPFVQGKVVHMLIAMTSAAALLGAVDYVFTRQSYMKKQRMSRREIKEEMRQSEGDPMVKAKLRQIRQERAKKRMLAQVPQASVVITNPTHYAVALRYEQGETPAPICLAKGVDDVALRIREVAQEHNVPIVEDPPLARALFAAADVDEAIPREHYEAVAKVIGFVMRLANRRRRMSVTPNRRQ